MKSSVIPVMLAYWWVPFLFIFFFLSIVSWQLSSTSLYYDATGVLLSYQPPGLTSPGLVFRKANRTWSKCSTVIHPGTIPDRRCFTAISKLNRTINTMKGLAHQYPMLYLSISQFYLSIEFQTSNSVQESYYPSLTESHYLYSIEPLRLALLLLFPSSTT